MRKKPYGINTNLVLFFLFQLTKACLVKALCRESGCYFDLMMDENTRDMITISYKPTPACKRKISKMQKIINEIQTGSSTGL